MKTMKTTCKCTCKKDMADANVEITPCKKVINANDIVSVSRTIEFPKKVITSVKFSDGTETKATLNRTEDKDDPEKAIMWCLLKKCFSSKRGLEKIIYALEDVA